MIAPLFTRPVESVLHELYGESLAAPGGVVHVAAVWARAPEQYAVMRICDETPKSDHDQFVLHTARARADAIVTTGKILREEPHTVHEVGGPGERGDALRYWRRHVLGKSEPPFVLILTTGRDFNPEHPALCSTATPIVYTTADAAQRLQAAHPRLRVVGDEAPCLRRALSYLRQALDCRTITVEAGPSTSAALYRDPAPVDELMLSVLHGEGPPRAAIAAPFVPLERIRRVLPHQSRTWQRCEPSGTWAFCRFTRR
jgi:riboflavin biosynthesis pyrimidine reductase